MAPQPWISVTYTDNHASLWMHQGCFQNAYGADENTTPTVISLIGGHNKSLYLAGILGYTQPFEPHGQLRVAKETRRKSNFSQLYLDCEISLQTSSGFHKNLDVSMQQSVDWFRSEQDSPVEFSDQFTSHVLTPLSSIICYFAADLHGLKGVASMIARQVVLPKAHKLPSAILPQILVVSNTRSKLYDQEAAQNNLRAQILQELTQLGAYSSELAANIDLDLKFGGIEIVGLHRNRTHTKRVEQLLRHLSTLVEKSYWSRRTNRFLFNIHHIGAFAHRSVQRFCKQPSTFDYLRESRPDQFDEKQVGSHLSEAFTIMPNASWLWKVVAPLLGSSFCLANYPPDSHLFNPDTLFDEFFSEGCRQAIKGYVQDPTVRQRFILEVKKCIDITFRCLEFDSELNNTVSQHVACLESLWPHLANLKSFRACLSCFMFMPEKVFSCGHAVCNVCIRRFGQPSKHAKHTYEFEHCLLCGVIQQKDQSIFRLMPPTAGIRVLCLDGGGIKGVIPLIYLEHLSSGLNFFGNPIHEYFDYVSGTSAGGLIAIGIFLMHWDPSSCLQRFEELAATTFKSKGMLTFSQNLQRMFQAWVHDHRYNLSPIERAFHAGPSARMFNPLQNDTKVAVTATSVRDNIPCVITNYNGGVRSDDNNYSHIRATRYHHEMTISDAAACTSAAPFFFKSKDVDHLDTFQDGGLRHNNPAQLTSWECAILWPEKGQILEPEDCQIDFMVSLGTGTSLFSKHQIGPHSPKRDRFIRRLVGSYMCHLDGEEQWRTFIRCIPSKMRSRCHRLNVTFPGTEPALDDVTAIDVLKRETWKILHSNLQVQLVQDTIVASIFYFEVDRIDQLEGGSLSCSGTVYCRLPQDLSAIHHTLREKHACFVIEGRSVPCVESEQMKSPIFRRPLELIAKSMEDKITISVTGITSEPTLISGMPVRLRCLSKALNLYMPFGCVDNRRRCRDLPTLPSKRKAREF